VSPKDPFWRLKSCRYLAFVTVFTVFTDNMPDSANSLHHRAVPPAHASVQLRRARDDAVTAARTSDVGKQAAEAALQRVETEAAGLVQRVTELQVWCRGPWGGGAVFLWCHMR
jgi:hypothetical protein